MSAEEIFFGVTHLIALALLPVLVVGLINRVKSRWSGRRGQPILQLAFDLVRLSRKTPVYSHTTTAVFRLAPYVVLATAVVSGLVVPLLGAHAPLSFPFDFVLFAYVWGLGRIAIVLGGLDTGSAFEGMGASREATYAAILEPAFLLVAAALCVVTGERSLGGALALDASGGVSTIVEVASVVALFILVQVEAARMPVDDPTTHLELTMIHEVMILDHSGPELGALELASAIKLTTGLSLIATMLNPFVGAPEAWLGPLTNVLLCLGLAVVVGTVESLTARLKLRAVPQYILVALIAAAVALLATTWRVGGHA